MIDPELVHDLCVAIMHGEICTALTTDFLLGLLAEARIYLSRVQGNAHTSAKPDRRQVRGVAGNRGRPIRIRRALRQNRRGGSGRDRW